MLVFLSLGIALIYIYTDWLDELKNQSTDLSAPFYWVTSLPNRAENWADNRLMSREKLIQENEALRTEVLVLKRKAQQTAGLEAENMRLRHLLNSADSLDDQVLIAELIGVSPDPNEHKVVINRGQSHGVYEGQALLDASGLMGQIVEVGQYSAKALLITDTNHAIPVQISRNGVRLIAQGVSNLFELDIPFVANTEDIVVGDELVSSGLGQRFPAGYPVATISAVHVDPGKSFARVIARPKAELNRSRHVLLVFDKPPAETN